MVVVNIWYIRRIGAVTQLALFSCTMTAMSILSSVWRHLFQSCAHRKTSSLTVDVDAADILGPVDTGPTTVRTIVRFDYARGTEVAAALRAEVIRAATSRRRPAVAKGVRSVPPPPLRVRFDDVEPFLED